MSLRFRRTIVVAALGAALGAGCGEEEALSVIPDDFFEPNDSFGYAFDLSGYEGTLLTDIPGNQQGYAVLTTFDAEDYFVITVPRDGTLTIQCLFSSAQADLNLSLYDVGMALVATGAPNATGKDIVQSNVLLNDVYYIKVELASGTENAYDMVWDVTP